MEFLLFAIPFAAFIIIAVVIFVGMSSSNSHLNKMDTQTKIKLEESKKKTIEKINKKKSGGILAKNNIKTNISIQQDIYKMVEDQEKQIKQLDSLIDKNKSSINKELKLNYLKPQKNTTRKLEISNENLVRGIITMQYLDRRKRG